MYGAGLLKGLGITLKHTFAKDITIQYPEERPFLQERFRGSLAFNNKNCIICGQCLKACPNNVLSYETELPEGSKKKRLVSYTIDLQYCLFCNLCVEACVKKALFFEHHFELSTYNRDDIKRVYIIPAEAEPAEKISPSVTSPEKADDDDEDKKTEASPGEDLAVKRLKQVTAMKNSIAKNPQRVLTKWIDDEADRDMVAALLNKDSAQLTELAEIMMDNREQAGQWAAELLAEEKANRLKEGGEER